MTSTIPLRPTATALERSTSAALQTVRRNIEQFGSQYPDDTTVGNRYLLRPATADIPLGGNRGWTTSFWVGLEWLGWELTQDDVFQRAARSHVADFIDRVDRGIDLETHDLGFLYSLSCVAAWRLTGHRRARQAALDAAQHLMRRFLEPAGIIQAWGDLSDLRQRGRTIIDSLMNLPLLVWAGQQTGDPTFADAAQRHAVQLRDHIIRPDGSTFHTFYWDAKTGQPLRGATEQGASDASCWARGQAWGIYGFTMAFEATGDESLLDAARRCAEYFIAHLPADAVPYWDLVYGSEDHAPRDSSAAAIAVCGLLELADADPSGADRWRRIAGRILTSLSDDYTPSSAGSADALLLHGVYDLPKDVGVDEGNLWGDYFYLEALARHAAPEWKPAW